MANYTYLIIGGGMAADAAVKGIRSRDKTGTIGLLCAESHPPYARPPLSKSLRQISDENDIWLGTQESDHVDVHLNTTATAILPDSRKVRDSHGGSHTYEKLLLATGSKPQHLAPDDDAVLHFRTFDDHQKLQEWTQSAQTFTVVGGGFIGSEIAAALISLQKDVTLIFPEETIGGNLFPEKLGSFLTDYYAGKGVKIMAGTKVETIESQDSKCLIRLNSGKDLESEKVIVGIGVAPNDALARELGLEVNDGVVVDSLLRTSGEDIFAAGDVANVYYPRLNMRIRCEHETDAVAMGKLAGQNMAGAKIIYDRLPVFYSTMFDLNYEALGKPDREFETISQWQEPMKKGVIVFHRQQAVRGILFWGLKRENDAGEQLFASSKPWTAFELHEWCRDMIKSNVAAEGGAGNIGSLFEPAR